MNFNEYQEMAKSTAIYDKKHQILYPALGLAGEAGDPIKGIITDASATLKDVRDLVSSVERGEGSLEPWQTVWTRLLEETEP